MQHGKIALKVSKYLKKAKKKVNHYNKSLRMIIMRNKRRRITQESFLEHGEIHVGARWSQSEFQRNPRERSK